MYLNMTLGLVWAYMSLREVEVQLGRLPDQVDFDF